MKKSINVSLLLSIVLAVIANVAYSQNDNKPAIKTHVIAGIVTEAETGDPLPGVNVVHQRSNKGIATDADGKFTFPFELGEGETLAFSFIGLDTQFYKIGSGDDSKITVSLKADAAIHIMEAAADNDVYVPRRTFVGAIKGWFR